MDFENKEIRGLNLKIIIAWIGGVVTFVILGTLWYSGINTAIRENKDAMQKVEQALNRNSDKNETELKLINQRLDAQQIQIDQLKWQTENILDYNGISKK